MQVSDPNNVKIYNLSAGKSLPEWLSERKRRALLKKNAEFSRRIELIQDFDMPGVSNTIRVSNDGQYILATGIYKPRIKCFDVNNLSLKFERCFDSEAVTFEVLSEDYSKLVFLQCDRYVEFHAAHGRYHRLRIPKFGRDMKYHRPSCDLIIVGATPDIYRLNLERGQFMTPFSSPNRTTGAINRCAINPVHNLLVCGTQEGKVEAWDPRSKDMIGELDCAYSCISENSAGGDLEAFPSVSALKFNGALQMAVGTMTGQILLYDIRSNKPYFIKDHMYGLPIRDVDFHHQQELVYSMDSSVLKIWNKNDGKLYTSIESGTELNSLCLVPNTGLLFMANESPKMQTFYIPSLGAAPRWASFLDSLTEELEESQSQIVYDDYKFITRQELTNLGLDHLIGTNLLRAYMHGFFIDVRLYRKAKSVANPFEFDVYKKKKIKERIEMERVSRVKVERNLPKVNRELAMKLMDETRKKKAADKNLLTDDRFKALFENPDFEVNKNADEYRLINPVLSKLDKSKKKKKSLVSQEFQPVDEELEGKNSSEESSSDFEDSSSEEDEQTTKEIKKQYRLIAKERKIQEKSEEEEQLAKQPKLFELRQGEEFKGVHNMKRKQNKSSLGERLQLESASAVRYLGGSIGNREMTFSVNKKRKRMDEANRKHMFERKSIARRVKK